MKLGPTHAPPVPLRKNGTVSIPSLCIANRIHSLQEELRALRPDGTIVTETRHTKEQERVCDEELSKDEVMLG